MSPRIGHRRAHFPATDSTNNRAAELAIEPGAHGTVITADLQTQGRGQHGRVWESARRVNVLLSALLYPPPHLLRPTVLTALAAVAVAECVRSQTGADPRIKWPNDVLVNEHKVCGILIERGHGGGHDHAVVGIGLNVNSARDEFERAGLFTATSLSIIANRYFVIDDVVDALIDHLDHEYASAFADVSQLEDRWCRFTRAQGAFATVELMDSHEHSGRVTRISFDGIDLVTSQGTLHFRPELVRHVRLEH